MSQCRPDDGNEATGQRKSGAKLTIQLDASAVERIFADANGEIPVEIKNAVVAQVAEKHLKGVLNQKMITEITKSLTTLVESTFYTQPSSENRYRKVIKKEAASMLRSLVNQVIVDVAEENRKETLDLYQQRFADLKDSYYTKFAELEEKYNRDFKSMQIRMEKGLDQLRHIAEVLPDEQKRELLLVVAGISK